MQGAMSSDPEHNEGGVMGSFIGRVLADLYHRHDFMDKKSPITAVATVTAHGVAPGVLYSD